MPVKPQSQTPQSPVATPSREVNVTDISSEEAAQILTVEELRQFISIPESELSDLSWVKINQSNLAPYCGRMIKRTFLRDWIVATILNSNTLDDCVNVIIRFLEIGTHLKDFRNYNTFVILLKMLTQPFIRSLFETHNLLSTKHLKVRTLCCVICYPFFQYSFLKRYSMITSNFLHPFLPTDHKGLNCCFKWIESQVFHTCKSFSHSIFESIFCNRQGFLADLVQSHAKEREHAIQKFKELQNIPYNFPSAVHNIQLRNQPTLDKDQAVQRSQMLIASYVAPSLKRTLSLTNSPHNSPSSPGRKTPTLSLRKSHSLRLSKKKSCELLKLTPECITKLDRIGKSAYCSVHIVKLNLSSCPSLNHSTWVCKEMQIDGNDPEEIKRFEAEIRVMEHVRNESQAVVCIKGCIRSENSIAILMPFFPNTLHSVIYKKREQHQTFSAPQVFEVAKQIASGLLYLHSLLVVHCDIKVKFGLIFTF